MEPFDSWNVPESTYIHVSIPYGKWNLNGKMGRMLRSSFNTLWEMEPAANLTNSENKSGKSFNTLWEMEPG